jgi:hypothetical protein
MPQPAPARFDDASRHGLRVSLATSLGPFVTMAVLIAGYALSARGCSVRPVIGGCIALAALGCAGSIYVLSRAERSPVPLAARRFRTAAIGLQLFSLCVLAAFGLVTVLLVPCD